MSLSWAKTRKFNTMDQSLRCQTKSNIMKMMILWNNNKVKNSSVFRNLTLANVLTDLRI